MLVLTRKLGESIYIGAGVKLTIVEVKGQKIRLGIEAPESIPIWREELVHAKNPLPNEVSRSPVHSRRTCPV